MFRKILVVSLALFFIACGGEKQENAQNSEQKPLRVIGATVLLELLYPQGIAALWYPPRPEDLEFMPKGAESLPVLGMQWDAAFEKVVALKPDLLIFGKRTDRSLIEPYEKVGIRTLQLDGGDEDLEETLPALGEALGVREKAQKLLNFARARKAHLNELLAKVQKKPKIYFAFAIEGLTTECEGEQFDLAAQMGAENVVKCEQFGTNQRFVNMNFEQLIALQPEAIFVREIGLYKELMSAPNEHWQRVQAVKDKKIYYAPSSPSNWLHRPPSVMRVLGYSWAFSKLHPELLSETEFRTIAKEFFAEFLRPISDEDYARLEGKE